MHLGDAPPNLLGSWLFSYFVPSGNSSQKPLLILSCPDISSQKTQMNASFSSTPGNTLKERWGWGHSGWDLDHRWVVPAFPREVLFQPWHLESTLLSSGQCLLSVWPRQSCGGVIDALHCMACSPYPDCVIFSQSESARSHRDNVSSKCKSRSATRKGPAGPNFHSRQHMLEDPGKGEEGLIISIS